MDQPDLHALPADAVHHQAREHIDIETINIANGLLLPVWNQLPDATCVSGG